MAETDVSLDGLIGLLKADEQRRQENIKKAITEAATEGSGVVEKAAPSAFGELSKSVSVEESEDSIEIVINAPYAGIVELGARPHNAPLEPLIEWATRIGAEDPRALAVAIQKKIADEGSAPTHFTRDTILDLKNILNVVVSKILGER